MNEAKEYQERVEDLTPLEKDTLDFLKKIREEFGKEIFEVSEIHHVMEEAVDVKRLKDKRRIVETLRENDLIKYRENLPGIKYKLIEEEEDA